MILKSVIFVAYTLIYRYLNISDGNIPPLPLYYVHSKSKNQGDMWMEQMGAFPGTDQILVM